MPKLVKRISGGRAKMIVTTTPGTLPMPNSMTMGTRYTNAGVVCMASRIGRVIANARSLRASQMPSGNPTSRQKKTEVSTKAKVTMASDQAPISPTDDQRDERADC